MNQEDQVPVLARWQQAKGWQRLAMFGALLYLLYALIGYFLLSSLARDTLRSTLSEITGRDVQVERVVFNPLTLSITVHEFSIPDDTGEPLFAFQQFHVNFQLSSLPRWSWHFKRIALLEPQIQLARLADEDFNFSGLLAQLTQGDDDESAPAEDSPFSLPRFSFGELTLQEGNFRFLDLARTEPEELVLTPITFDIRNFSTRGDGEGHALLLLEEGAASFELQVFPEGELPEEGLAVLIEIHEPEGWTVVSENRILP